MGRKRPGQYIFEWWISDHPPRHVHVYDSRGEFLGRVAIEPRISGMGGCKPPREIIGIIQNMMEQGEL